MNSNTQNQTTASPVPLPDLEALITALSHSSRWRMLKELTCGETRTIDEMAQVAGCSYDAASKHLAQLWRSGVVERVRGRVYQINRRHLPVVGEPVVDCGHCLLRLGGV